MSPAQTMSPEELKAQARRLAQEVFTQGDLAVADELVSADYIHHVPGPPPLPGVTGLKEQVTVLRRAFPDLRLIVEDEIAEADRVMQRITVYGTHEGELLGIPATGRQVMFDVIDINRVGPDGRFAEHWSSVDQFGLLRQLGALPADAAG